MKMITIKSQKEFDQLRDDAGNIRVSANLEIHCHITTHGGNIFTYGGSIVTHGGDIGTQGGNITTDGGYIGTHGGNISTQGGNISTQGGNVFTDGGDITTESGDIVTQGGDIGTDGGNIFTQGGKLQCRILYWRLTSKPAVPADKMHVEKVRPDMSCRKHWEERLGMSLLGYYLDIEGQLEPLLPDLLKLDKWTSTERWILESHLPKEKHENDNN